MPQRSTFAGIGLALGTGFGAGLGIGAALLLGAEIAYGIVAGAAVGVVFRIARRCCRSAQ